jgi:hypothetical protein
MGGVLRLLQNVLNTSAPYDGRTQIKLSEAVSNLPPEVSFLDALICMYLRALVSDITSRLYFLFFKRPISYP